MPPDVVVSIALGGPSFAFATLKNVVTYTTSAHLIVHLSAGSDWGPRISEVHANYWISEHCRGRVTVNPKHLRVQAGTPGVLGAHLSNFDVCEARGLCASADAKFVLLAANVLLLRHGLEQHVATHSLSFCVHNSFCADASLRGVAENHAWRESLDRIGWHARLASRKSSSPAAVHQQAWHSAVHAHNDSAVVEDSWIARYVKLLRSGRLEPAWLSKPLAQMPHEGSFYPVRIVRDFVQRGFHGSVFDAALRRQQASQEHTCPCCGLYGTSSAWKALGSCCLEELLLPTFAWQRHAGMLHTAAPPSVLRLWVNLNHQPHNASRVICRLIAAPRELRHFYGIKIPHFYAGKVGGLIREARASKWCRPHDD